MVKLIENAILQDIYKRYCRNGITAVKIAETAILLSLYESHKQETWHDE